MKSSLAHHTTFIISPFLLKKSIKISWIHIISDWLKIAWYSKSLLWYWLMRILWWIVVILRGWNHLWVFHFLLITIIAWWIKIWCWNAIHDLIWQTREERRCGWQVNFHNVAENGKWKYLFYRRTTMKTMLTYIKGYIFFFIQTRVYEHMERKTVKKKSRQKMNERKKSFICIRERKIAIPFCCCCCMKNKLENGIFVIFC